MAALALPILALGGIYIYCNSNKKKKEPYSNLNSLNTLTNNNFSLLYKITYKIKWKIR